ncbi:MAG: phosphatidylglycerophosphatase A [Candidatus Acidiferrales bacterium]
MSADSGTAAPNISDASRSPITAERKPRLALFIATACGLGYIPVAPGTWGSIGGLIAVVLPFWVLLTTYIGPTNVWRLVRHDNIFFVSGNVRPSPADEILLFQLLVTFALGAIGVWSADKASRYWRDGDPQRVVIDEVSGQHLTLLLGCGVPTWSRLSLDLNSPPIGVIAAHSPLNWKYLLLGFILFRVFDIWKPFPARQAESLPGGWGIMADDWIAGIYAAIGLWLARAAGL